MQFSLFSFPEFSEKVFFSTLPKPQRSNRRKRPYRLRFFQESVGPLYYNGRFPAQAQGGTLHEPMGKARFLYFIRKPKFGPIRLYCVLLPQLAGPPLRTDKKQWDSSRALEKLKGRHGFMPIYTNRRDGAQLRNLFFSLVFKGSALEFIDFGPNRPKKWPWVVTGKGHLCELSTPGARGAQCPRVHN